MAQASRRSGSRSRPPARSGAGGRGWGERGKSSRPALARALEAVRAGETQALVVTGLDRLAGSLGEAARLLERTEREGWNVVALDLGLDLQTAAGTRLANAFATVAEWERRLRSERAREALARRRAQ
jgi:DNA invertase Pin-like site-specific DNA recombinase